RPGPLMAASDAFEITVKGRQTHGSRPWNGVDPIVAAADLVSTAQTIVSRRTHITRLPAVLTFGAATGGIRPNLIPDPAPPTCATSPNTWPPRTGRRWKRGSRSTTTTR